MASATVSKRVQPKSRSVRQAEIDAYNRANLLQIVVPGVLLALLAGAHCFAPGATAYTEKFFAVSYCNARLQGAAHSLRTAGRETLCAKGIDDAYLVATGILAFTMIRAAMMTHVFTPLGLSQGIRKPKALMRFSEQAWGCTYAVTSCSIGMYLYYNSEYWLDMDGFYSHHPRTLMSRTLKLFYLLEFSFWLQQILSLNVEARRKDYMQMFGHHILTSVLMFLSYTHHMTRVGHTILTLMDFADIFLPLAKMLKYTGHQTLCDGTFVMFLLSWVVTRHYLLTKIIVHAHMRQPVLNNKGENVTFVFVGLLSALEILICVWSYSIAKILVKVVRGAPADDTRSDTEDSDSGGSTRPSTPSEKMNGYAHKSE
ncbi:TLC domain-domain-containing protein [Protomyces lactucae-debilis]|uniref:TLC domain-domain-containing protein n=1 Tax=Protomyces lactucae-debilis TaxID=2754530 RepID=A0A1Y2FH41_PROLT|nr:TLC domain-containing protein [Protomyces lactucae-debilis]ORY83260.1 TLC domain-domain-containing protein [Protomyces lactucae-debilis]